MSTSIREWMNQRRGRLVNMNLAPVNLPERPSCDYCDGLGMVRYDVPVGHPEFGKLHMCTAPDCPAAQKIRASRAKVVQSRAGLPSEFQKLTFETFYNLDMDDRVGKEHAAMLAFQMAENAGKGYFCSEREAALPLRPKDAEMYSEIFKNSLVLQGDLGLGKTGLAAAITNWVTAKGYAVTFYRVAEMFADIQSAYSRREDGPDANDVLLSIQKADLLVLDELNMTPSADKVRIIEEIIRYRHARRLATVITCNINSSEFKELWGNRTGAVLMEMAHWMRLTGRKLRRAGREVESF